MTDVDFWNKEENIKLMEQHEQSLLKIKKYEIEKKALDECKHKMRIQMNYLKAQLNIHEDKEINELQKELVSLRSQIIKHQPAVYTDTFFYTLAPREDVSLKELLKVINKLVSKKWLNNGIWVIEQRGINDDEIGKGKHLHLLFKRNGKSLYEIDREFLSSVKNIIMQLDKDRPDYKEWLNKFHNFRQIKDEDVVKLKEYILGEKDERNDKTKKIKQTFDKKYRILNNLKSYYIIGDGV